MAYANAPERSPHFSATRINRAGRVALALLPGINILTLHAVLSDAVTMQRADILPTYASGIIGMAFGVAFFAPLWSRLPIGTEGEFLLWRFRGQWAPRLHAMRSALLGLIVLPLFMGALLIPLREVLVHLGGLDPHHAHIALGLMLITGAFTNSFKQRMRMDRILGVAVLALMPLLVALTIAHIASPAAPSPAAVAPTLIGMPTLADVLVPMLLLWWFANIIDLPSMVGQKLLSSTDLRAGVRGATLGHAGMLLITGLFLALPIVLGYAGGEGNYFSFLARTFAHGPWKWTLLAFYLLSGLFLLLNIQHWAGALVHANLVAHHAPKLRPVLAAAPVMLAISAIAFAMQLARGHAFDVIRDLLLITAGVGPVFILRWFVPRINAQVQFTAMIGAMVHAGVWMLLARNTGVAHAMEQLAGALGMPVYMLQIGFVGTATLLTAAVPFMRASAEDVNYGRMRLAELHHGRPALWRTGLKALALCVLFMALVAAPMVVWMIWG